MKYGVGTDLVQRDSTMPTGFVRVTLDESAKPTYEITEPAAWDAIAITDALLSRAADARAIVFGSLAQRHATSRATLQRLWDTDTLKVFDVNLRPPFDDREIVRESLRRADIVKISDEELQRLAAWFDLRGDVRHMVSALAGSFACSVACVSRGSAGAALWHDGQWAEHSGYPVEVRDTVGAGDAFLAALLVGLFAGERDDTILQHANRIGAQVASQSGALPAEQREI